MNEEEIRKFFENDPSWFMLILFMFAMGPNWDIPQTEKIKEMIENMGGNENV